MTGAERRRKIMSSLSQADRPISASRLAQKYAVSRQVIVGDVALLRAAGTAIKATSRGYLLTEKEVEAGYLGTLVCDHSAEQTQEELLTIVSLGGEVLDVKVTHPIYGEISANLELRKKSEVLDFIEQVRKNKVQLLSSLTSGVHTHQVRCETKMVFETIRKELAQADILYQEK